MSKEKPDSSKSPRSTAPREWDVTDMRDEYDFSDAVRGKHYSEHMAGSNVVVLDPDVAELFPNSAAVNRALRRFVEEGWGPARPTEDKPTKGAS